MNEYQQKKAQRLWDLGHNTAEIARAIKAHEGKVEIFLSQARSEWLDGKTPKKTGIKPRKCLSCDGKFDSDGDRVCKTCKRRESWTS